MTKEEIYKTIKDIDPTKDVNVVYNALDELGVKYKKTACHKCRRDLYNILLEELNIIEDASLLSDFNDDAEYVYTDNRTILWRGNKMNQDTPKVVIREFIEATNGGGGYYLVRTSRNKAETSDSVIVE